MNNNINFELQGRRSVRRHWTAHLRHRKAGWVGEGRRHFSVCAVSRTSEHAPTQLRGSRLCLTTPQVPLLAACRPGGNRGLREKGDRDRPGGNGISSPQRAARAAKKSPIYPCARVIALIRDKRLKRHACRDQFNFFSSCDLLFTIYTLWTLFNSRKASQYSLNRGCHGNNASGRVNYKTNRASVFERSTHTKSKRRRRRAGRKGELEGGRGGEWEEGQSSWACSCGPRRQLDG